MAEAATDLVVYNTLVELGFTDDKVCWLPQGAKQRGVVADEHQEIWEVQQGASKKGSGAVGHPEFIITILGYPQLLFIIEDKEMPGDHEGPNQHIPDIENRPQADIMRYAVDGALWYAKKFSERFHVIALAVSGTNPHDRLVSTFLHRRCGPRAEALTYPNAGQTPITDLVALETYLEAADYSPEAIAIETRTVKEVVDGLHGLTTKQFGYTPARTLTMSAIVAALQEEGTYERVVAAQSYEAKRTVLIDALRARYESLALVDAAESEAPAAAPEVAVGLEAVAEVGGEDE